MTRAEAAAAEKAKANAEKAAKAAQVAAEAPTTTPFPHVSTTSLGFARGAGTSIDLYDPGTEKQRAYMRSLDMERLADAKILEDEEEDYDEEDEEDKGADEEFAIQAVIDLGD
ncbi:MAG: hypothetical protein ACRYE7_01880 [Janthinobacterium lividum]